MLRFANHPEMLRPFAGVPGAPEPLRVTCPQSLTVVSSLKLHQTKKRSHCYSIKLGKNKNNTSESDTVAAINTQ